MPFTAALPLRRRVAPATLALAIFAFAAGSSPIPDVTSAARTARWALLVVLFAVAIAALVARRSAVVSVRLLQPYAGALAFLAALGVVSAAWSVSARLSAERGLSFVLLALTVLALAAAAVEDDLAVDRYLGAVLAAAGAVAVAGAVLALAGSDYAVQRATPLSPWRYQGFGMNPNTDPMLFALALPVAASLAVRGASTSRRVIGATAGALLIALIILSESRGALLASFGGTLLTCFVLLHDWRRRAAATLVLGAAFLGGNVVRVQTSPPLPTTPPASAVKPIGKASASNPYVGAPVNPRSQRFPDLRGIVGVRPEDEIGHPAFGAAASVAGSGRIAAWKDTLKWQVRDRPLLGYGFGTESKVFVDRWYYFEGALPENSYLGYVLQLGVVGLLVFLSAVLVLLWPAVRLVLRNRAEASIVGVTLGMFVSGLLLMLAQSYVYSVGNVATLTFWLGASLLAAAAARGAGT